VRIYAVPIPHSAWPALKPIPANRGARMKLVVEWETLNFIGCHNVVIDDDDLAF
jgi:hypothetical protein